MIREKENPGYAERAGALNHAWGSTKTLPREDTFGLFLDQSIFTATACFLALLGAAIDLRALAWSVRVAVRRDEGGRHG